jgi:hypothetical protein
MARAIVNLYPRGNASFSTAGYLCPRLYMLSKIGKERIETQRKQANHLQAPST